MKLSEFYNAIKEKNPDVTLDDAINAYYSGDISLVEQGTGADIVDKAQESFYNTLGGTATGLRGLFSDSTEQGAFEQAMYERAAAQQDTLSTAQKIADQELAEGNLSWKGLGGLFGSAIGSLGPSMVLGGLGGAAVKAGASALGATGKGLTAAQATGFGATGIPMLGGAAKNEVETTLGKMTDEQLSQVGNFERYKRDFGEDARSKFIQDQSQQALSETGALGFLTMGIGGPALQAVAKGALKGGVVKSAATAGGIEATQEFIEEGGQARIVNPLVGREDWEDVAWKGTLGAMGGFMAGTPLGAIGGVRNRLKEYQSKPKATDEANKVNQSVFDGTGTEGILTPEQMQQRARIVADQEYQTVVPPTSLREQTIIPEIEPDVLRTPMDETGGITIEETQDTRETPAFQSTSLEPIVSEGTIEAGRPTVPQTAIEQDRTLEGTLTEPTTITDSQSGIQGTTKEVPSVSSDVTPKSTNKPTEFGKQVLGLTKMFNSDEAWTTVNKADSLVATLNNPDGSKRVVTIKEAKDAPKGTLAIEDKSTDTLGNTTIKEKKGVVFEAKKPTKVTEKKPLLSTFLSNINTWGKQQGYEVSAISNVLDTLISEGKFNFSKVKTQEQADIELAKVKEGITNILSKEKPKESKKPVQESKETTEEVDYDKDYEVEYAGDEVFVYDKINNEVTDEVELKKVFRAKGLNVLTGKPKRTKKQKETVAKAKEEAVARETEEAKKIRELEEKVAKLEQSASQKPSTATTKEQPKSSKETTKEQPKTSKETTQEQPKVTFTKSKDKIDELLSTTKFTRLYRELLGKIKEKISPDSLFLEVRALKDNQGNELRDSLGRLIPDVDPSIDNIHPGMFETLKVYLNDPDRFAFNARVGVSIDPSTRASAITAVFPDKNREQFKAKGKTDAEADKILKEMYVHELVHDVTSNFIRQGDISFRMFTEAEKRLYNKYVRLYNDVTRYLDQNPDVGAEYNISPKGVELSSLAEFVAYGLTRKKFQDFLKQIPVTKEDTAFTSFVKNIMRTLGLTQKHFNSLSKLISVSEEIMDLQYGQDIQTEPSITDNFSMTEDYNIGEDDISLTYGIRPPRDTEGRTETDPTVSQEPNYQPQDRDPTVTPKGIMASIWNMLKRNIGGFVPTFPLIQRGIRVGIDKLKGFQQTHDKMEADSNEIIERYKEGLLKRSVEYRKANPEEYKIVTEKMLQARYSQEEADLTGISQQGKDFYNDTKEFYKEEAKTFIDSLETMLAEVKLEPKQKTYIESMVKRYKNILEKDGIYFPFARFGEYIVRYQKPSGDYYVAFYDSYMEALRIFEGAREQGMTNPTLTTHSNMETSVKAEMTDDAYTELERTIDNLGFRADDPVAQNLRQAMFKISLVTAQKGQIRNKGRRARKIHGATSDMTRAIFNTLNRDIRANIRRKYINRLNVALNEAEGTLRQSDGDYLEQQRIINELKERVNMSQARNKVVSELSKYNFLWHMGFNFSSAITNLTQMPLVAAPVLGSKTIGGRRVGVLSAVTSMNKELSKAFRVALKKGIGDDVYTAEELDLFNRLKATKVIDTTRAHMMAQLGEGDSAAYNATNEKFFEKSAWMFHNAEVVNRTATAMGAAKLYLDQNPGDIEGAVKFAHEVTLESHFDYSEFGKGRHLRSNIGTLAFAFQSYSHNMVYFMVRNFLDMWKASGATPEQQAEARYKLGTMFGALAILGGTTAMPVFSWIANSLLEGEEPEEIDETWKQIILKGPLAVLSGADVSSRVSLSNPFVHGLQYANNAEGAWEVIMKSMIGPIGGYPFRLAQGYDAIDEGKYSVAFDRTMPSFITGPKKAGEVGLINDGVSKSSYDTAKLEYGPSDYVWRALGFSPTDEALINMYRNQVYTKRNETATIKKELLRNVSLARVWDIGNYSNAMRAIQEYNREADREDRISRKSIKRSIEAMRDKRRGDIGE